MPGPAQRCADDALSITTIPIHRDNKEMKAAGSKQEQCRAFI